LLDSLLQENKPWFETLFLSNQTSMATKTIRPLTSGAAAQVLGRRTSSLRCLSAGSGTIGPDRLLPATSPASVTIDGVVKLRMETEGVGSRPPISCHTALKNTVDKYPGKLAWVDHMARKWTYEQYWADVTTSAKALIELGLDQHRSVAILGHNSPEWFSSSVGAVLAGGVATGVYTTNTTDAVLYQLKHSQANIAVVDGRLQLEKVLAVRDRLPDLRHIIMWGEEEADEEGVIGWREFQSIGKTLGEEELRTRLEEQAINQPAVICYTSGTTANPKGALLSQDNLTWTSASATEHYELVEGNETLISYLPVSHIVAQVADIWMVPIIGGTIHFADKDALKGSLLKTLTEVRPTRFVAVPRVFEKMHSQLEAQLGQATGAKGKLVDWARGVTAAHYDSVLAGGPPGGFQVGLAEKLLLSKIHAKLGLDRCTHGLYSGAAPLSHDTMAFMRSIGLVIGEIYGMTENPNNNANYFDPRQGHGDRIQQGSVGRSAPGCQTRLHLQDPADGVGEVATTGRNVFMGYLGEPGKTRETFDRGFWLLTGDMATIDNGFVTIRGRIKDVIITSGGKNIAPYPIEDRIKSELADFVSNCVVVGDKQKHLACLITVKAVPDPQTLEMTDQLDAQAWEWCNSQGCKPSSVSDLIANKEKYESVWDAIMDTLNKVNRESSSKAAKVRKFVILPTEFSISGGELGPTLKIKRFAVEKKYAKEIEAMYVLDDRHSLWDD